MPRHRPIERRLSTGLHAATHGDMNMAAKKTIAKKMTNKKSATESKLGDLDAAARSRWITKLGQLPAPGA